MGTSINKSNFNDINTSADITKLDPEKYYLYSVSQEIIKANLPTCDRKYWKDGGGAYPVEMDQTEKDVVDAAEAAAIAAAQTAAMDINNMDMLTKAISLTLLDAINIERAARGVAEIGVGLFRTSVITKYQELSE